MGDSLENNYFVITLKIDALMSPCPNEVSDSDVSLGEPRRRVWGLAGPPDFFSIPAVKIVYLSTPTLRFFAMLQNDRDSYFQPSWSRHVGMGDYPDYTRSMPPSTDTALPVIKDASSEARNRATLATSSG